MNYVEVTFTLNKVQPWRDVLISTLADRGFESFVETKTGFQSYIPEPDFSLNLIQEFEEEEYVEALAHKVIEDQNWNATWEENFDPVLVEDRLAIIAPFHDQEFSQKMVITIQPQMSFGTGHHQTTWLASRRLFEMELSGKSVLDMGTGTGILAILSEKLGAKDVYAPDIDEWSYRNALENIALNNCKNVTIDHGDDSLLKGRMFDLIIANINKNILISHFSAYSAALRVGGKMLISGFFETDQPDLVNAAKDFGFVFEQIWTKEEWALIQFRKEQT